MQITDAHAHIFPAKIARKATQAIGRFYGEEDAMRGDGTQERLKESYARCGITRAFVHSVATTPAQVAKINDFIASAESESDGLFVGFATMHPDYADIAGELDRAQEMGLVGVKLHPDMQSFAIDEKKAMKIYEEMCRRNMPLIVHTGDWRYELSNPQQTARVARAFPEMKIQAAHFGGYTCWERVEDALGGLGLYTDCSSSLFALEDERAAGLIRFFGADHVMFGSDFPMWQPEEELERFLRLSLTDEERAWVLGKTADRFLDTKVR